MRPDEPKIDLRDLTFDELKEFVREHLEEKSYRAKQIYEWLYRHGANSFEEMTSLKKELRLHLQAVASVDPLEITEILKSEDGTEKLQFRLQDGAAVEAVLIPNEGRMTLCLSTQVGCAMGCAFCFTGTLKLSRNLTQAEIVDQYRQALRHVGGDRAWISNVVLMGMGEPLQNLDNVVRACDILMDDNAYGLSARRVTVSTSGLIPQIRELQERSPISLAVSLNATTDEVRSRIMPVNKRYPMEELIRALEAFPNPRRARILIEYVLLAGVNDGLDDARRLAAIAGRIRCKVNLIPFNPHERSDFRPPEPEHVLAFQNILLNAGINTFCRQSRGQDIHGACGMLGKGAADGGEETRGTEPSP